MAVTISRDTYDRADARYESLLDIIGMFGVSSAQDNVRQQIMFDGTPMPKRYPNQSRPKVNVAGILSDFNRGTNPPSRRFSDAPVLQDTGALFKSITHEVKAVDGEVDVLADESIAPYAAAQNDGIASTQPVTEQAKKSLATFLRKNKQYQPRLGFLFARDELTTKPIARKFIGVSEELEGDVAKLVEEFYQAGGEK